MAGLAVDHARAAVAAEVVEGAQPAVLTAQDQRAFAQQIEGQPVAGRRQVVFMGGHLPVVQEDLLALDLEQRG